MYLARNLRFTRGIRSQQGYGIYLLGNQVTEFLKVCLVLPFRNEVWPAVTEAGVRFFTWYISPFETEVGVDGDEEAVKISIEDWEKGEKWNQGTYCCSGGCDFQSGSRFKPGWGHAGHNTAHSPALVAEIPPGSYPRMARLSIFRCRYCRTMTEKERYRS